MTEFDKNNPEENFVILMNKIDDFGLSCLELADEGSCLDFIASTPVQNMIEYYWYGEVEDMRGIFGYVKVFN